MSARPAQRISLWLLVLAVAIFAPSAGCAGDQENAAKEDEARIAEHQFRLSGTQRDAQFTVGGEGFTEQKVLGNITIQALDAAGATVIDRTGLGGNEEVRQALISGEIDLYWEYTATGNDTYAIAASQETSRKLGVETISDLGRLLQERPEEATLCFGNEDDFSTRFDGLPGLERAYGFQFPEQNLIIVSLEAVYEAVEESEICNFGVVFTTSGFIQELDLRLLEDDKDFFAVYNPSLTMRRETFENYPQLRELFAPISEKLDTETLRRLNYAVDVEREDPEAVAERWLRENGFIE
jgi:osmoprotectant transport system substrate-binding protein